MNIHVLSGDSLVEPFTKTGIPGEIKVCREALIDGDLEAEDLSDFWEKREKYLTGSYPEADGDYSKDVRDEFIALWNLSDAENEGVNLWFDRELFCQVNMWFTIWLLRNTESEFYAVYPILEEGDSNWKGLASLDTEGLKESFEKRIKLNHNEVFLAVRLYEAFRDRDFETLVKLSKQEAKAFPTLEEVCEAAAEIETRPKAALKKIVEGGETEFGKVFQKFSEEEAVYGFGDLQVKRIFDEIKKGTA